MFKQIHMETVEDSKFWKALQKIVILIQFVITNKIFITIQNIFFFYIYIVVRTWNSVVYAILIET